MDTVGEGEGGKNWESSTETCVLPCVKSLCWGKNNFNFALLNFAIWYWNAFLNKRGYVVLKKKRGLKQSTLVLSHSFAGQEQPCWVTGSGSLLLSQSSCASLDDYPKAWLGLEHPSLGRPLTDLASWCWLLAGGLTSFPRGPLYSDTWIISQEGSWLPPEKAIQEIARRKPLRAFMSKFQMSYCQFRHILFTKSELLNSTHSQREGIGPHPPESNIKEFVDIFLNHGRQLSNK